MQSEAVKDMVRDMETVETLLGNKGRFVGDMVHISIKDLASCIAAQSPASAWLPIDTCPKERGKPILILDVEGVKDVGWWSGEFKNRDGYMVEPEYWMPIPPAPLKSPEGV